MKKIIMALTPFLLAGVVFFISGCPDDNNDNADNNAPALSGNVSINPDSADIGDLLTAAYSGEEEVTFQWKKNGNNSGEASKTNNTYTPEEGGVYTVTVSLSGYKSKISNPVIIREDPRSILSGNVSIIAPNPVTGERLTAAYSGNEQVIFQWRKDGIDVGYPSKTNPNTYTPPAPGNYTVTVTRSNFRPLNANSVDVTLSPAHSQYTGRAYNPIFTSIYSADPSAHVWPSYPDRLFVYPSQDVFPAPSGFDTMDRYHVFSTGNMQDWVNHGEIIRRDDVADQFGNSKWPGNMYMWAPDAFYYDKKPGYGPYFFITGHSDNMSVGPNGQAPGTSGGEWNDWAIYVFESDNPYMNFRPNKAKVLQHENGTPVRGGHMYDPCVFEDDDGKYYAVVGGGNICHIAELDVENLRLKEPFRQYTQAQLPHYNEGPWMFYRYTGHPEKTGEKIYYVMYAGKHDGVSTGSDNQGYATATSPYGPWTYQGPILDKVSGDWTSHGSIVEFKGQWYLFYHTANLSTGTGNLRSAHADLLYFNPDGTIQKVEQTTTSVPAIGPSASQTAVTAEFGSRGTDPRTGLAYDLIETKYPDMQTQNTDFSGLVLNKTYPAAGANVEAGGSNGPNIGNRPSSGADGTGAWLMSNSGAIEYMNDPGAYAIWRQIDGGTKGGRAALKLSYGNLNNSIIQVTVNGTVSRFPLSVPSTGNWQTYIEGDFYLINLQPGDNNIIRFEGGAVNIKAVLIYLEE